MITFEEFVQRVLTREVSSKAADISWYVITRITEELLSLRHLKSRGAVLRIYERLDFHYQGLCNVYNIPRVPSLPLNDKYNLSKSGELLDSYGELLQAVRCDIIHQTQIRDSLVDACQNFDRILTQAYADAGVNREFLQRKMMP